VSQERDDAAIPPVDVLAVGAHPDDVEWGCGGVLAGQAMAGRRVGILVLTRGEAGTRGAVDERRKETEAGAKSLGAQWLSFLDLGDGQLRNGSAEEEQVMCVLRRLRPSVVLAPPLSDRHPDHERAGALVRAACFYAGLVKRVARLADGEPVASEELEPFRPKVLMHYMLHDSFDPDVIVDCTPVWRQKLEALAAHQSQFPTANGHREGSTDDASADPVQTWVSKRSFWEAIEGRARHYGQRIGVEFAEPLHTAVPLGLSTEQFSTLYLGGRLGS